MQSREAAGLTQPELAKLIVVSKATISFWENNVTSPKGKNLIKLADALGVSGDYLMTGVATSKLEEEQVIFADFLRKADEGQKTAVLNLMKSMMGDKKS